MLAECGETGALRDAFVEHGLQEEDVYFVKRSTPPQQPQQDDQQYQEKMVQFPAQLEAWSREIKKSGGELDIEQATLATAEAKRREGRDVAVIYCLDTNAITVKTLHMDEQPTAVKPEVGVTQQVAKFQRGAAIEDPRLVVGFEYADARVMAFEEITRQLAQYGAPMGRRTENTFGVESIAETYLIERIVSVQSLVEDTATANLSDVACMQIYNTQTGARVGGTTRGLPIPEEAARLVFEGRGELTVGKALGMLFYREESGTLVPVVDPRNHQDPHRDMAMPGYDRKSTLTSGVKELMKCDSVGALSPSVISRNGQISVTKEGDLPLNPQYLERLGRHRQQVAAGLLGTPEQMLNEYLRQQAIDGIVRDAPGADIIRVLQEAATVAQGIKRELKMGDVGDNMAPLVRATRKGNLALTRTGQNLTAHAKAGMQL